MRLKRAFQAAGEIPIAKAEIKSFIMFETVADHRPGRRFATPNSLFLLSKNRTQQPFDLLILKMFQLGWSDWRHRIGKSGSRSGYRN